MTTVQVDADIDFLSSVPSEILQASGPYGTAYDLQLRKERAQAHLWNLRETIAWEIARSQRPGSLGLNTPDVSNHPEVRAQEKLVEELTAQVAETQATLGGIVFLPAVDNLPEIERRLATLNRRAAKLGTEEITLTVTDETLLLAYKTSDEDTRAYDFEHVFAVLAGGAPKIPGYEFLATITPTEAGNVVKRIPAIAYGVRHNLNWQAGYDEKTGREISDRLSPAGQALENIDLSRFHSTADTCEHCHTDRRRSDLYVVYNEKTGEAIQVGRTCLRDYMGSNDPERVLKHLEQVTEFIRSIGGSRGETPAMTTEDFLTHCATRARVEGGYVRGLGYDASRNYFNRLRQVKDKETGEPQWVEPTAYDEREGASLLKWAREEWDETSEFATNVKLALANEVMNLKLIGLGGAVVIARQKWLEGAEKREVAKAQQKANAEKRHIGTEGQREVFTLTLKSIKWINNPYGYGDDATKPLMIMTDPEGNEVKWFASDLPSVADKDHDNFPVVGGTYEVKATVKRHDDDERWGKSTVITRAKFQKTINEPEGDNE